MTTKTKVKHRVTFAPDTKTETEQLDCLVRAIEFRGPGIDELANMIQNIHMDYSSNSNNKRKPSFDSRSIIEQLRSTLDSMLDSELAETCIKSNTLDSESIKDNNTTKEDGMNTLEKQTQTLYTIDEKPEREFKTNHDSGISDIEFDLEKIKNNEVSPQARRRASGLINKLDTCITELQRVTDTIEEETVDEVKASLNDNTEVKNDSNKEALPPKNGKPIQLSIDTNVGRAINNNSNNNNNMALYSEPASEPAGYYVYGDPEINNYDFTSSNSNEMTQLDLIRKGIYAIPNQPTVIEACYSGFLLSTILTVVADDCSVLYFGILTENNLYFYNSTDDNEPMFGRIIIDQNTIVIPITNSETQDYLIEITGVYVLPDNQVINSKVRIKFNNKQERSIWYKVIKTTVNDWKIKASYVNNPNPTNTKGKKRRLSFLSPIQLHPQNHPKRTDSLRCCNKNIVVGKKSSDHSEVTLVSPDSAQTITNLNDASTNPPSSLPSPNSATTLIPEENYGNVNPSQSILSALHVLEALERKRNNQELKK